MQIRICSLWEIQEHLSWPTHVISIIQKDKAGDLPCWEQVSAHVLQLQFDDIQPAELLFPKRLRQDAPREDHVRKIVDFAQTIPAGSRLLVHCEAGISRSTASAWIALCARFPEESPLLLLNQVLLARPEARPSPILVAHADRVLQKNGNLLQTLRNLHTLQGWRWVEPPGT
jgi:predicted protein tyrosine phosphatase